MGYSPWDRKELDMTEATNTHTCTQEVRPSLNQLLSTSKEMDVEKTPIFSTSTENCLNQGEAAQTISVGLLVRPSSRWWH